jgi:shikimate kinase
MNVLLMGPRAAGKSTIGRLLADRAGRRFVELDELTLGSLRAGSVGEAWGVLGEEAWRSAEAAALRQVLAHDDQVVALGGGTPTIEEVRRLIEAERRSGRVVTVYLSCSIPELQRRLRRVPGDRPPLCGADPVAEVAQVVAEREPVYRRLADHEIDVTSDSAGAAAEELAHRLLAAR